MFPSVRKAVWRQYESSCTLIMKYVDLYWLGMLQIRLSKKRNGFFCSKSVQDDHSHLVQSSISSLNPFTGYYAGKPLSELRFYTQVMLFKTLLLPLTNGNWDCQNCEVILYWTYLRMVRMLPKYQCVIYFFNQMKLKGTASVVSVEECGEFLIFLGAWQKPCMNFNKRQVKKRFLTDRQTDRTVFNV